MLLIFGFYIFSSIFSMAFTADCGNGWIPYKDELCYKIADAFGNAESANLMCGNEIGPDGMPSTPIMIKSKGEQDALTKIIFEDSKIVDNVWLGGKRGEDGVFRWNDGSNLVFTNWAENSPSDSIDNNCIQLTSKLSRDQRNATYVPDGLLKNVPCGRRNVIACQKLQTWSSIDMQKLLIELRRKQVPIGFIYTQLPWQQMPEILWPHMVWKDVTQTYAGHFFRAYGGASAKFEVSQADNTRRIVSAQSELREPYNENKNTQIADGQTSAWLWTGDDVGGFKWVLNTRFTCSAGEIRPKNLAVKIWKRIY